MNTEQEIIIWLAGLLSTDGIVQAGKTKNGKYCFFAVYSVELPWLTVMKDRLAEIQIKTIIHFDDYKHRRIQILNPQYVRDLLLKYECGRFFNPRKWARVLEAYTLPQTRRFWTPPEEQFLRRHLQLSDKEIGKKLGKTKPEVYQKRRRLGIPKSNWKQGKHSY